MQKKRKEKDSPEQLVEDTYLMVNDGKTHNQHTQLVGWRYHKGIALSPEFKGYISSNKQPAARSNNDQVQ